MYGTEFKKKRDRDLEPGTWNFGTRDWNSLQGTGDRSEMVVQGKGALLCETIHRTALSTHWSCASHSCEAAVRESFSISPIPCIEEYLSPAYS